MNWGVGVSGEGVEEWREVSKNGISYLSGKERMFACVGWNHTANQPETPLKEFILSRE